MPRILLIGKKGQLGSQLEPLLAPLGDLIALERSQLDLSEPDTIREYMRLIRPDLVINAGAYTAVDKAEEEPVLAQKVNALAPAILAEELKKTNGMLIHYSTDYVFNGDKHAPYTEDDEPSPLNRYGQSKLEGEQAIQAVDGAYLILRTSWIYGLRGQNFLMTIKNLLEEKKEVAVVDDQIGVPNDSSTLALATVQLVEKVLRKVSHWSDYKQLYHLSAKGATSWFGFAEEILKIMRSNHPNKLWASLKPVATEAYPSFAQRPAYSVLSTTELQKDFGIALPPWQASLASLLKAKKGPLH
ncbi:dTDP-4-dehydrorhamnose reductase [Heliorestis acidaminivorans]|uniref:dTDP-4-dehydrorhamnose reductase n=1 Tax=Heliorestis acidaminivorans TaxID=553427 RepID=A0A6I0EWQ1_9FIRM|nr:dTDP-4-dehydrorhamnose reductase [Heliorestis acidaminivorans]KAB2951577.1 dTDP-4-dehydrorhamnose reductase [Heliorestis acidaminivorans]